MERIDTARGIDPLHARQRWWQDDDHQRHRKKPRGTKPTSTSHDGSPTCGSTTVRRGTTTTTNVDGHGTQWSDGWATDHCTNTNRATNSSTSSSRGISRPTISSAILISFSFFVDAAHISYMWYSCTYKIYIHLCAIW